MTADAQSREGWRPEVADAAALAQVIDEAFDYRGDVTVVTVDGREVIGYLFNRDPVAPEPFVQIYAHDREAAETIPYARIRRIAFTGKDTAAGNSYAAWLKRKQAERSRESPAAGA